MGFISPDLSLNNHVIVNLHFLILFFFRSLLCSYYTDIIDHCKGNLWIFSNIISCQKKKILWHRICYNGKIGNRHQNIDCKSLYSKYLHQICGRKFVTSPLVARLYVELFSRKCAYLLVYPSINIICNSIASWVILG
jgi:hypothetical protein